MVKSIKKIPINKSKAADYIWKDLYSGQKNY
jgi:hypothetical protein